MNTHHALPPARKGYAACALIVLSAALTFLPPAARAQSIPFLGDTVWMFRGIDFVAQRGFDYSSVSQAAHAGLIIAASNTVGGPANWKAVGDIVTVDYATGRLLRQDSVCPETIQDNSLEKVTIRSASVNDSATVLCYNCWADGLHLVRYPSFEPIEDTMIANSPGGWLSNTGRYMVLSLPVGPGKFSNFIYDRQTGDTMRVDAWPTASFRSLAYEVDFSSDDRFVTLKTEITGPGQTFRVTVVNLAEMRVQHTDLITFGTETGVTMTSYHGHRILLNGDRAVVGVFDAETGARLWALGMGKYPAIRTLISADGAEVLIERSAAFFDTAYTGSAWFFRYRLPETEPSAVLIPVRSIENWFLLQPKVTDEFIAYAGSTYITRYTYDASTGVPPAPAEIPILRPNPASGDVTMSLGECTEASWVVSIFDSGGRLLSERTVACEGGMLRLDVSGLASGTYVVQARAPLSVGAATATAFLVVR